jgi:hypothetical protein
MDIPQSYIIHDMRTAKDFKGITLCGYKRKDVINAFQNSIINNKLEDAIRWCVELHSTGLNKIIWDTFHNIYTKYIHINSPKLFFYLLKREKEYNNIIKDYPKKHEIFTRNDQELRNMYAELTSIMSITKKNNMFLPKSLPSINTKSFEKEDIHKRMISKSLEHIQEYIFNNTSNDTILALNEIINNLLYKKGTFQNCIYWYLWIEKSQNSKKKENQIIFSENKDPFADHWIFILWKIIMDFSDKLEKNNKIFLNKLHSIYKKNFKPTFISKRKYYIFIAFYIIKSDVKWNINIFQQEYLIIQSCANINKMYENIINNIQSNLSYESKEKLRKSYNKLLNQSHNIIEPKKIKNTNLNEEINKVVYTNYPEFKSLEKDNDITEINEISEEKPLISKNMTLKDIEESKEEKVNKRLQAFTQFITFKKKKIIEEPVKEIDKDENSKKTVMDYYKVVEEDPKENSSQEFKIITKNINLSKKK